MLIAWNETQKEKKNRWICHRRRFGEVCLLKIIPQMAFYFAFMQINRIRLFRFGSFAGWFV